MTARFGCSVSCSKVRAVRTKRRGRSPVRWSLESWSASLDPSARVFGHSVLQVPDDVRLLLVQVRNTRVGHQIGDHVHSLHGALTMRRAKLCSPSIKTFSLNLRPLSQTPHRPCTSVSAHIRWDALLQGACLSSELPTVRAYDDCSRPRSQKAGCCALQAVMAAD